MKKTYTQTTEEVLESLSVGADGLTTEESSKRHATYGPNKLAEGTKPTLLQKFLAQLKDPMLLILMAAAAVSAVTSIIAGESLAEVAIILVVVLLNAILGVIQESKAEAAIEALQTMTAATCKVIRDGKQIVINADQLVPGDIVVLEAGDAVPADGRIIECASLKIEEAALTGESVPVNKMIDALYLKGENNDVPLGDRKNMVYMGSTVVYGRGKAVVTGTGMNTEMGKIAGALAAAEDEQTPLQKKLSALGKTLSKLVLGICVFIFAFNLIMAGSFSLPVVLETFMVAVSLAVAAIPEGLATVVTVVLSIGVTNMSKRNAVIRKLTAVETLGCTQVICSDKTGTLTQNKMTVVDHVGETRSLCIAMALCSDANVNEDGKSNGEPTEAALVEFAAKEGFLKHEIQETMPRVDEAPFDSMRKMMSTVHEVEGSYIQFTKGAPDEVLKCCTHCFENGKAVPLTDEKRAEIMATNKAMADKALRVLAAAERHWDERPIDNAPEFLEQNLIFIGLTGMIDPVRPEVKAAIDECRSAGIRPVMITGDHKDTAVAIAKELGIVEDSSQAITGAELEKIPDEDICEAVKKYGVYARVQPEHKTRIVNAWKKNGCIVAMTGDGCNDAPSIKSADIGVGMGITGTDVTKNVADMVLADDNFATIVTAASEGRRIYDNIRKAIQFLLASNMSEVLGVFVSTLIGFTLLNPVHLLFINLITDTFPALALGMEEAEPDVMSRPPRKSDEGIFAGGLGIDVIYQGVLVTVITMISYLIGNYFEFHGTDQWVNFFTVPGGISNHGMTMAFLTMSMCEVFHSFNMRSQRKSVFSLKKQNKILWAAMFGSIVLTTLVLEVPFLANAFGFTQIGLMEYGIAVAMAILIIPIVEIVKIIQRKIYK
jgi:Ca2+-transporting ATPase